MTAICLFFFLGCTGKSAQIPLYVWLPDAMAGPTPVSALIHAATMVTAGVYLIARSSALFSLAPAASLTVALVGGLTAIFAATIGLKQWDIKKVLAYSTVSQLGYMFVGVGVGAYVSGVFHLVTHAFFKALLFLGSGSVIYALHAAYHHTHNHDDAQDMRNMGGLRKYMPVTFWLMWIATLAIAGMPLFAGFFSKDEILSAVFARAHGSPLASATWLGIPGSTVLYLVYVFGLAGALLTAIYMTRMMLYTFHGPNRTGEAERAHLSEAPWIMTGLLIVLGIASLIGGWLNLPEIVTSVIPLGPHGILDRWLDPVVGHASARLAGTAELPSSTEGALIAVAVAIAITGIVVAVTRLKPDALVSKAQSPESHGIEKLLEHKYYVDEIYDAVIVQPTVVTLAHGAVEGHRRRHHRRPVRQRQRAARARDGLDGLAAPVGAGGHVCLGSADRRACAARRLHPSPLSRAHRHERIPEFDPLQRVDPPGPPAAAAHRRGGDTAARLVRAQGARCDTGAHCEPGEDDGARVLRCGGGAVARPLVVRRHQCRRLAGVRELPVDSVLGRPHRARRRRHRDAADPPHHLPHAARGAGRRGRASARSSTATTR